MKAVPKACAESAIVASELVAVVARRRVLVLVSLCALALANCSRTRTDLEAPIFIPFPSDVVPCEDRNKTIEERVRESSAIIYCRNVRGRRKIRHQIREILYVRRDSGFTCSMGDRFPRESDEIEENVECGEGQIVFVTWPLSGGYSAFEVYDGKIASFDDMPLTEFRKRLKTVLEMQDDPEPSSQSRRTTKSKGVR
jgi:hypothetical protein